MINTINPKDIVKEAMNILNNNIEDESNLRKMIGQLLIDEVQSTINNWDESSIPNIFRYDKILFNILEDIFNISIPEFLSEFKRDLVSFRNKSWGNSFDFSTGVNFSTNSLNKMNSLYVLDKNNNLCKQDIIDYSFYLSTKYEIIPFDYRLQLFMENQISLKQLNSHVLMNIEKNIVKQLEILSKNVKITKIFYVKPIKICYENGIIYTIDSNLCFTPKIGIGMLGD